MGNCWSRFKSSDLVSPPHHGSTPSWPSPMEPSPPSGDPFHPPASPSSMEPSLPISADPRQSSSPNNAVESLKQMCEKIDPLKLIDLLVRFIENQLDKMNTLSEAGPSSSEGWLETVLEGIQHAAVTVDTISKEAERVSESEAVKEIGRIILKVLEGMKELYQVFIGLSLAVFKAARYSRVRYRVNECDELLVRNLQLSKNVEVYAEQMLANGLQMSEEKEKLCNAVVTIMEGAIIACNYSNGRFWLATTAATQIEKTNRQVKDITDTLALYFHQRHWDEDVFLSHSGKQKNFVRQLYGELNRENVLCFFDEDDDNLPIGQKFPCLIFKAAETCKKAVVVLSKEFILSKWPMLELSAFISIKKTGKNGKLELIPIFFKISLDELLDIIKDNPEWKKMEESDFRKGEWLEALKEVRSMRGLELPQDGNEVDCRNKVVIKICCLLKGSKPSMVLEFKPVGIKNQQLEVEAALDMKGTESGLAVIIYGIGGIGKITRAASVI